MSLRSIARAEAYNHTATIRTTLAAIRAIPGVTARWNADTKEYRVNLIDGDEATTYYTTDAEDALDTAEHMARNAQQRRLDAIAAKLEG